MPKINGIMCRQANENIMTLERGDAPYNTAVGVLAANALGGIGIEKVIWQATVPAQYVWRWGYGSPRLPMNQGYGPVFAMIDPGVAFEVGTLRIASNNYSNIDPDFYLTLDDTRLHTPDFTSEVTATPNNIQTMHPMPEGGAARGFSSKLQLLYTLRKATVTPTNVIFSIPYTEYLL
jgi:hypothetical protein